MKSRSKETQRKSTDGVKKGVFLEEVTLQLNLKRYVGIREKAGGRGPEPLLTRDSNGTKVLTLQITKSPENSGWFRMAAVWNRDFNTWLMAINMGNGTENTNS